MGLISRVSSRTYRNSHTPQPTTWVFHAIHGTNAERLVVASHKCTKKENSKWEDQLVTPRSLPNVCMVRTMGGNKKFRALRLDHGNFGWASEGIAKTTRIVDVVYNATSNELVRTKTLVKGAIVVLDASPFRSFYESHYALALGRKKNPTFSEEEKAAIEKLSNCGKQTQKKYEARQKDSKVDANLVSQFLQGKLLAKINSRPGQCGRADGYILEGEELDFYTKKLKTKKSKA